MSWRVPAAYLAVGLLWGSAWLLASSLAATWAGPLTFLGAAIPPAIVCFWKRRTTPVVPSVILGAAMIGIPYILSLLAADYISSSIAAVLGSLLPLFALLAAGDDASAIPTLVIGAGGVALMLSQGISFFASAIVGILLILFSLAWNVFALLYARQRLRYEEIPASLTIQFVTVAAMAAVFRLVISGDPRASFAGSTLAILFSAIFVQALGMALYYWLLLRIESWQAASVQWLAMLISVAESVVVFHGRPSGQMLAGAGLTVGAILWLFRRRKDDESLTLEVTN